jgi:FKBP-type peptidyl-prolyl cis-trans isomerase
MKPNYLRSIFATLGFVTFTACAPTVGSGELEKNKAEGAKFLENNKQQNGIVTTASGLQYQVLQEGSGAQPKATDTVTVNYKGSLISGKQFDAGDGIRFPLRSVIPGWTEGVQLMKQGAKYKFFIPSDLAYGDQGAARVIPPGATLIFEVDLVKVGG